MFVPQAMIEFTVDYLGLRKRLVNGTNTNVKAIKCWIRIYGRKMAVKAEQETVEYYTRNRKQMNRLSGYEKALMRDIHSDEDDDE